MQKELLFIFLFSVVVSFIDCNKSSQNNSTTLCDDSLLTKNKINETIGEALFLPQFKSLDELKSVVSVKYLKDSSGVSLSYCYHGSRVTNELLQGFSQDDFSKASKGNFWEKLWLAIRCPFVVWHKGALISIENLGRRKNEIFGQGDVAFYDLAETMVAHISDEDKINMTEKELSDKGFLNTFEHVTSSALMTSLFSESISEFVGDAHERPMKELMTGNFSKEQIADVEDGPVDNYIDMINNERGENLGKILRDKYHIHQKTFWTPQLLADYLNDVMNYYSWVFQIAFKPFTPEEEIIERFAEKMNIVL